MLLLIDFSNVCYLSFFGSIRSAGIKPEECHREYRDHVDVFKKKIEQIYKKCYQMERSINMALVMDDKPTYRLGLYPEYKANRKKDMEINPKKAVIEAIKYWGVKTVYSKGYEADDVIATYVARYSDDNRIVVVTTDKDMWQLNAFPNTCIMNPQSLDIVTENDLKEKFNVNAYSKIKLHKALWGDASDRLLNLMPRTQKHLLPIIDACNGDLDDFYRKLPEYKVPDKVQGNLKENKEKIEINYKLAKLNYNCKVEDWEFK